MSRPRTAPRRATSRRGPMPFAKRFLQRSAGRSPALMDEASPELLRKVSVVIPTLNEGDSIGAVIDEIPKGVLEILVVDGNSKDGTQEIARGKGARVVVEPRKGYGRAYKTGFLEAKGEIIATLDGDLTYPASRIGEFAALLEREGPDFITCDRLSTLRKEAMS